MNDKLYCRRMCYDTIYIKSENMQNNYMADMDIFVWYKCIKTCMGITNLRSEVMLIMGKPRISGHGHLQDERKGNGSWRGTRGIFILTTCFCFWRWVVGVNLSPPPLLSSNIFITLSGRGWLSNEIEHHNHQKNFKNTNFSRTATRTPEPQTSELGPKNLNLKKK